jgi:hypothetical protein
MNNIIMYFIKNGATGQIRTAGLLITNELLYP